MDHQRFDHVARLLAAGITRRSAAGLAATGSLALFGARRGSAVAAQDATPAAADDACPTTTLDENKALIERYWAEVWTAGGEATVPDLLAEDEIHHWGIGDDTVGHEQFIERLNRFLAAFPDFAIRIDQLVAEGDMVVSRWTATGTHEGDWLGIPATGTRVEYTGTNLFRVACGTIAESWGHADHLGLLRQLGALPEVATPAAG